mmetsp:Transcript_4469/g.8700  ORF Transcript_4469/g.8700 Transcript_4469/m.8700 type:complete len:256 (+) Transcript_4469:1046-1813(+)
MRGFWIFRGILECVTSLLNMTPEMTRQSEISPPGTFSTLAYRLTSTSRRPAISRATVDTALSAISTIMSFHRDENLVPRQLSTSFPINSRSPRSTATDLRSHTSSATCSARLYPLTTTVGCRGSRTNGSASAISSPASTITEVVPSPTSSSWARESSIMDLAQGWLTSTSRRMQLPSLVRTMPPMGSRSILSMERGPRVVRMILETARAAVILFSWAFRPVSRLVLVFNTITCPGFAIFIYLFDVKRVESRGQTE